MEHVKREFEAMMKRGQRFSEQIVSQLSVEDARIGETAVPAETRLTYCKLA